ncbi:PREDICTED: uncharacterized protein LOC105143770 [Acromyrmex echinatior]|uniref:uncharacterized protein LOC105143770 n=1 Tax=Acromyrmex echinatior TaxID=103372 RepID=UPI000580EC6A|nr:PREDICTED: uncharacterized protein LOC105143770 [Acromyrmex echinatior]
MSRSSQGPSPPLSGMGQPTARSTQHTGRPALREHPLDPIHSRGPRRPPNPRRGGEEITEPRDIVLTLLCAICVLGDRRYIAIPVDDVDDIDIIKVNAITPSLSRIAKQTKAYVSSVSHQDDSVIQRSERLATHVLDYVDFGGYTGSNGAFSWYADYPAHRS